MTIDLSAWSDKWEIAASVGKVIIVPDDDDPENDEVGTAQAEATKDDSSSAREAEPAQWGKRKRKRGGGGRQKREWQQWREVRNGALLAQQYRQRVQATRDLCEAAQRAAWVYSPEELQRSREEAVQREAIDASNFWRRTWSQHTRQDQREQSFRPWEEPSQQGSPLHPNPRARIRPTRPPAGLQSKSRGAAPGAAGRTLVEQFN